MLKHYWHHRQSGLPIALPILLIFRIDRFMQEIVTAQKEGYRQVLENTEEIHNTITTLNQQDQSTGKEQMPSNKTRVAIQSSSLYLRILFFMFTSPVSIHR